MGVIKSAERIVGDYALVIKGVTLSGTGKPKRQTAPTLGENVVVGAGAKVLKANCKSSNNVRNRRAGSVVLRDVPSDTLHSSGRSGSSCLSIRRRVEPLGDTGDSLIHRAQVIRALVDRIIEVS
jgi:serine O-acetyltransferase